MPELTGLQPDRESAVKIAQMFIAEFEEGYPQAIETSKRGPEDSLQFYSFFRL
jgi:hypothetical protein